MSARKSYARTLLFMVSPMLIAMTASLIAKLAGSQVDEGGAHPCVILGMDIGWLLNAMFTCGWFIFATVPIGMVALVAIGVGHRAAKPNKITTTKPATSPLRFYARVALFMLAPVLCSVLAVLIQMYTGNVWDAGVNFYIFGHNLGWVLAFMNYAFFLIFYTVPAGLVAIAVYRKRASNAMEA